MSSSSSLAKFSTILGTVREQTPASPDAAPSSDPATAILNALRQGMIPVADLPDRTHLSAEECLDTVEKLRSRQQVEIVEIPDEPNTKYIRLTSTGYAVFAA